MEYQYTFEDTQYLVRLNPRPDGTLIAYVGDRSFTVEIQHADAGQLNLLVDGQPVHAHVAHQHAAKSENRLYYVALVDSETCFFEFSTATEASVARTRRRASGGSLTAQMPGQVIEVFVSEGDTIDEGQAILILEAMKMEIRLAAPVSGTVTRLMVQEGDIVERGQQLAEVEPDHRND